MDFTSSNMCQGIKTFGGKSLHYIDPREINPYQRVGKQERVVYHGVFMYMYQYRHFFLYMYIDINMIVSS